jgi:hypothetical protein
MDTRRDEYSAIDRRAADAHAMLAPALEGFAPTPEFSEIEAAQALLAALAETDEVKTAAASRQSTARKLVKSDF